MKRMRLAVMVIGLAMAAGSAWANHMVITNVTVLPKDTSTAYVQFDLSWENSWRYTNLNHDAAWVFFKAQKSGATAWTNVTLAGSGSNPSGYSTGSGTPIEIIVATNSDSGTAVGLFVRRSQDATYGTLSVTNVKAVWNLGPSGLTSADNVKMQALAVEMVYVAQGPFYVGDGSTTTNGQFGDAASGLPFLITNEAYTITLGGTTAGNLGNHNRTGENAPQDDFYNTQTQTLPANFPKGYAAFYCMKYKITQGQYADFLNTLTSTQDGNRYPGQSTYRHTIGGSAGSRTAVVDRACNDISWWDGCAFEDWAGLRPMTELELEKACRGPLTPVADEYAWGSTNLVNLTSETNDGQGNSTPNPANANCLVSPAAGPCRVGIFATTNSTREQAGASYWGIMEMSGNLWERPVSVGITTGRAFTGLHGDGNLDGNGNANVSQWPDSTASGTMLRGGGFAVAAAQARVSDRAYPAYADSARQPWDGKRAVRTAPAGVGP